MGTSAPRVPFADARGDGEGDDDGDDGVGDPTAVEFDALHADPTHRARITRTRTRRRRGITLD